MVRDDRGEVQAAMAQVIPCLTDPAVAESMAAWRAVFFFFVVSVVLAKVMLKSIGVEINVP